MTTAEQARTIIQRIRWHVVNGNIQWVWTDEDDLDAIHAALDRCEKLVKAQVRKTRNRRERTQILRDMGLVRVKGSLGGVYWE